MTGNLKAGHIYEVGAYVKKLGVKRIVASGWSSVSSLPWRIVEYYVRYDAVIYEVRGHRPVPIFDADNRLLPELSEVPPADAQAIDGVWRNGKGNLFQIEKGREFIVPGKSPVFDLPYTGVVMRDIKRTSPGHYAGLVHNYCEKHYLGDFGAMQIDIVSTNTIRTTFSPNPRTCFLGGEALKMVVRFDDEQAFLREFREMQILESTNNSHQLH